MPVKVEARAEVAAIAEVEVDLKIKSEIIEREDNLTQSHHLALVLVLSAQNHQREADQVLNLKLPHQDQSNYFYIIEFLLKINLNIINRSRSSSSSRGKKNQSKSVSRSRSRRNSSNYRSASPVK